MSSSQEMTVPVPLMPELAQASASFAHTVDSAIHVLDALGVAETRITLRMDGPGRQALQVVRQTPPAGTPLDASEKVVLHIAGFGFFHALPLPMRESGGEVEMGTREICQIFDDPLQKAARWFRAGSPFFAIGPDKHTACRRWLSLFEIDQSIWPDELLYPLSLLLPTLGRLAGREAGARLAFLLLFGLQVEALKPFTRYRVTSQEERSCLGSQGSRLGRDLILGDRLLDFDGVTLHLGPVSLATYTHFQSSDARALLDKTAALCLSAYQSYKIEWLVEDRSRAPRLGFERRNGRLGINFHLGEGGVL